MCVCTQSPGAAGVSARVVVDSRRVAVRPVGTCGAVELRRCWREGEEERRRGGAREEEGAREEREWRERVEREQRE